MSVDGFQALGLPAPLARACAHAGYTTPSPVQQAAIPAVLRRQDLLAIAPTGSGKTAAYVLPLLHCLDGLPRGGYRRMTRVLVLVPTRELAVQVGESFQALGAGLKAPLKTAVLYGGVSVNPQMLGLRGGADVAVATPGRLLDLLERNAITLSQVETLVLDEADRLLDLGFADEVQRVLAALPARRQNLLLSATFAPGVEALAQALLHEPLRIEIQLPVFEPAAITQRAIEVDDARRAELLRHLIRQGGWRSVLVFVATRYATEHLARKLVDAGIPAAALHGELSQGARSGVLDAIKAGRTDVLVTTDLAARGIDIPALEVVVNFDLPRSPTDYVHRIGRTGRAGATGLAVSFVSARADAHFRLIESRQQATVPREQVPGFEPRESAPPVLAPPGTGGIKGRRPSKKDKLRAAAAEAALEAPASPPPPRRTRP